MKCVLFNDPFDYHGHIGSGNGNRLHKFFWGTAVGVGRCKSIYNVFVATTTLLSSCSKSVQTSQSSSFTLEANLKRNAPCLFHRSLHGDIQRRRVLRAENGADELVHGSAAVSPVRRPSGGNTQCGARRLSHESAPKLSRYEQNLIMAIGELLMSNHD